MISIKTKLAFIFSFMICLSLSAWEFHQPGNIPKVGDIVLRTPSGYEINCMEMKYQYFLTRYDESKNWYIRKGYWTLDDKELLDLFLGNIPFSYTP